MDGFDDGLGNKRPRNHNDAPERRNSRNAGGITRSSGTFASICGWVCVSVALCGIRIRWYADSKKRGFRPAEG